MMSWSGLQNTFEKGFKGVRDRGGKGFKPAGYGWKGLQVLGLGVRRGARVVNSGISLGCRTGLQIRWLNTAAGRSWSGLVLSAK